MLVKFTNLWNRETNFYLIIYSLTLISVGLGGPEEMESRPSVI